MIRGLYVHIPFCRSKCPYCDFNSYAGALEYEERYIEAVLEEAKEFEGMEVCTVYMGGGTPSVLSGKSLRRLMAGLKSIFKISADAEVTVEINPGTVDGTKLLLLKEIGINRLSIGIQSFDERTLKTLGRIHSPEDAKNVVFEAQKLGFENVSVDLMFSIPGQSVCEFENGVKTAVDLGVRHISCYGLKIEPGTVFYKKGVKCLSDDIDREMYGSAKKILEENGFLRYEISNFSKKGAESKHNLLYWKCAEYIGLGCGAHSYVNGKRYSNIKGIEEYISSPGKIRENICVLSEYDKTEERLIMGMRLEEGAEYELIRILGTEDILKKYIAMGYIKKENEKIKFTDRGFDVSNYILSELI